MRNNNPLNIRRVKGQHWRGERLPLKGDGGGSFCRFRSVPYALRAAFCILRTYATKHKANCIADIITRWAPPTENDTQRYIQDVCRLTGFGGKERLTEDMWLRLVRAMAVIESGMNLTEKQIQEGFRLYREKSK